MEQVLAPRFNFRTKNLDDGPKKDSITEKMDIKG